MSCSRAGACKTSEQAGSLPNSCRARAIASTHSGQAGSIHHPQCCPRRPPCRWELPCLRSLKKRFGSEGLEIFAVNVGEDAETVFDFIGNPAFPVLFDRDSKAMANWSVKVVPTTLLVDRQGRIAFRAVGGREFDAADIVALINQLLKS